MSIHIRSVSDDDIDILVQIALLAWPEVFRSFRHILGDAIYTIIWPDWKAGQKQGVETVCRGGENIAVWVAELDGNVAGFLAYELDHNNRTGEVQLLAVHPDYQNNGIGTALNDFALKKMREAGMVLARAETGGDPAHAPARKSYENAGYTGLPLVRYFKAL
jgi:ribosomal protein S18 acetylase RimI-like enzyme